MKGWEEFKASNDENTKKRDVVLDEKLAKITKELDKFEEINAKLTAAAQAEKDAKAEAEKQAAASAEAAAAMQLQLDEIEKKMNRPGLGVSDEDAQASERKAAFLDFARYGVDRMQTERKNVMTIADDTTGGYLAPPEYIKDILKQIVEYSPLRQYVRVISTSQKSVQIPKRTAVFAAVWVGEIESRSETDGLRYGLEELPIHELVADARFSQSNLEDSVFNLESELKGEFAEQFGVAEGIALISGTGTKKPEGILTASGSGSVNSGAATSVTADGILSLKYSIKTAYANNATFLLNRSTLGVIRKLKDGNGQYLWVPGLAQGRPNAIDGDPYVEMPDMPSLSAGTKAMAYGDWKRAYILVDRIAMSMIRDGLTLASSGQVKFIARRRLGGQVVMAEAFSVMTTSA
jgi:HK97 family phage major capsid protein